MRNKVKVLAFLLVLMIALSSLIVSADDYGDDGWIESKQFMKELMYISSSEIKDINAVCRDVTLDNNNKKFTCTLDVTCKIGDNKEGWGDWYEIVFVSIDLSHLDWSKYDYKIINFYAYASHNPGTNKLVGYVNFDLQRKLRNQDPTIAITQPTANSPLQRIMIKK